MHHSERLEEHTRRAGAAIDAGELDALRDALVPGGVLEIDGVRWAIRVTKDASGWLVVDARCHPLDRVWFAGPMTRHGSAEDVARELLDDCRTRIAEVHAEILVLAATIPRGRR